MNDFTMLLVNKDGIEIGEVNIPFLLRKANIISNVENIEWIGNRSILINNKYKVKGIGIREYTGHYGSTQDPLYNVIVEITDIKYMPYKLDNPKLHFQLDSSTGLLVVNQPYQEFIGEPIGGIGEKERNAFAIYKRLNEKGFPAKDLVTFKPIQWLDINFNYLKFSIPLIVYELKDKEYSKKTLFDTIDKKHLIIISEKLANLFYAFYKSGIIIPKDKNVLKDIASSGTYTDIADLYIEDKYTKEAFFMSLYLFFKELLFTHSNLYSDKKFLRKFLKPFLSKFDVVAERGFYTLDDILIANMVARLLKIPVPPMRVLNAFVKEYVGEFDRVGKVKVLKGYYYLMNYKDYNKSLYQLFNKKAPAE